MARWISRIFDILLRVKSLPLVQCCPPLTEPTMTDDKAEELETVFKALADRHRLRILNRLLAAGDATVCVCDLEAELGLKQPTVSYHLKQLLDAGIVEREKRGSFAYFSIADGALAHICGLLGHPGAHPASQAAATA